MSSVADSALFQIPSSPGAGCDFGERLAAMLAMETAAAAGDPERLGEIVERLVHMAAVTIAITAKGDSTGTNALLEVAADYLQATTSHAALALRMN